LNIHRFVQSKRLLPLKSQSIPPRRAADAGFGDFLFLKAQDLATTKGKRWNGNTDALPAAYLKEVMAKMIDYGDRV